MNTGYPPPDGFETRMPTHGPILPFPEGQTLRTPENTLYLAIVLEGKAVVEINQKSHHLRKGTFLFLLPGYLLCQFPPSADFVAQYLAFEFDFLSDFPLLLKAGISHHVLNDPCLQTDEKDFSLMKQYYDLIYNRYTDSRCPAGTLKGLLFSLMLEVNRMYSGQDVRIVVSRQNGLVDNFFYLLHLHYKRERTAAFYADKLCVSDKHLMRSIKKQTGHTLHFWMTDFIMREAKLMLKSTDLSITEVADSLHFPNSSFFARAFRKYTGMSPLAFRNENSDHSPQLLRSRLR
ncbi:MAG: AraC family transcriptional regulator [Paraprevotella sp.]|nr:AraC family transcriptional regulator [Paraprevotella sp.]